MPIIRSRPRPTQLQRAGFGPSAAHATATGRHLVATAIQAGSATKATEAGAIAWRPGIRPRHIAGLISFLLFALIPHVVAAQDISVNFGDNTTLTQRAVQLIGLITLLS